MKFNRLIKVLCILLVVTMMPIWLIGCGKKIDKQAISKMAEVMLGDGSLNKKNDRASKYLEGIDKTAAQVKATFSEGTWNPVVIDDGDTVLSRHYKNLYILSVAWGTKKSEYHKDGDVLSIIKAGLEYGYNNLYGPGQYAGTDGELGMMLRIDPAEYLIRTLIILKDSGKIKQKQINKYLGVVDIKFPVPFGDELTLLRTTYISVGLGALQKDREKVERAAETYVTSMFQYSDSGNGLYADGSYMYNTKTPSSGSYGVMAFSILGELVYALGDSGSILTEGTVMQDYLYFWAVKSVLPSLYNGVAVNGTLGVYNNKPEVMGGLAISAALNVAELLDETRGNEIKSYVKAYSSGKEQFLTYLTSYGACKYAKLVENDKITEKTLTGVYSFAAMDKLVVLGSKFSLSLSMSSVRSNKYETRKIQIDELAKTVGAVNGNSWYTGDGMLSIYTKDYSITSNYWKHVNGNRMPGTTVDSRERTLYNVIAYDGVSHYAGAVVQGAYAVAANQFYNNNNEIPSDLSGKKSWFILDGMIVALGAGITSSTVAPKNEEQTIETIIENVSYGSYDAFIDSDNQDRKLVSGRIEEINANGIYVVRYGGIYVPSDKNDTFKVKLVSTTGGGNFLELWLDHGTTPTDASYEYAIVPSSSMKAEVFYEFINAPTYEVISNTSSVQAVKDTSKDNQTVTGYTFWEAAEVGGVSTDFGCSIIIKETDNEITVSIADISQRGSVNLLGGNITLDGSYTLVRADGGLTFSGNTITVDRDVASNGMSLNIVLAK